MIDMEFFARAGSDPGLSACRKRSFRQAGQFCEELCSNEGSHLRAKFLWINAGEGNEFYFSWRNPDGSRRTLVLSTPFLPPEFFTNRVYRQTKRTPKGVLFHVTRSISRVLSWTVIYLGRALPPGSRHLHGTRRATLDVPPRCCSE